MNFKQRWTPELITRDPRFTGTWVVFNTYPFLYAPECGVICGNRQITMWLTFSLYS